MNIEELTFESEEYYLEDEYFIYDLMPHEALLRGSLPQGYTVKYENNIQRDTGCYEYKAIIFNEKNKLVKTLKANIVIYDSELSEESYYKQIISENYKQFKTTLSHTPTGEQKLTIMLDDDTDLVVVPEEIYKSNVVEVNFIVKNKVHVNTLFISKNILVIDGLEYLIIDNIVLDSKNESFKILDKFLLSKRNYIKYYFGDELTINIPYEIKNFNMAVINKPVERIISSYTLKYFTNNGINNYLLNRYVKEIELDKSQVTACPILKGFLKLESISLPRHIDKIPSLAFYNCEKLSSITIPNDVSVIEEYAFQNCVSLRYALLNEKLNKIGMSAFEGCISLKSIHIPSSIKVIRKNSFKGCESLEFISIDEGLERIEEKAFGDCVSLKEVVLPSSLRVLEMRAFNNSKNLKSIYINSKTLVLDGDVEDLFKGIRDLTVYIKNSDVYEMIKGLALDYKLKFKVERIK